MVWLGGYVYCLPLLIVLVGWRVGVWLSGPFEGLRKLRPRVELHSLRGEGESLGNGAETKRPPVRVAVMRL
jgi:hypothetical protein